MSMTRVRCKNCNGEIFKGWEKYSYTLKAHKAGTPVRCKTCKHISNPTGKDFDWCFCSKACLKVFLNTTDEDLFH